MVGIWRLTGSGVLLLTVSGLQAEEFTSKLDAAVCSVKADIYRCIVYCILHF